MATKSGMLTIEVVYAQPQQQFCISLRLLAGATVAQAIDASGLLTLCPEINLVSYQVGIFSRLCHLDRRLRAGDRVEIYRPLLVDPKEARRRRVAKKSASK